VFLLAKILELLGCADVGFALYVGIRHEKAMAEEFQIAFVGILVFAVGYLLEIWYG
jgi:hypothetical protein